MKKLVDISLTHQFSHFTEYDFAVYRFEVIIEKQACGFTDRAMAEDFVHFMRCKNLTAEEFAKKDIAEWLNDYNTTLPKAPLSRDDIQALKEVAEAMTSFGASTYAYPEHWDVVNASSFNQDYPLRSRVLSAISAVDPVWEDLEFFIQQAEAALDE